MMRLCLPLLCLTAALFVACGGGKSTTATPAPGQTADLTRSPAGTLGPSDTPAPTPQDPFQSLQAYRYTMQISSDSQQLTAAGVVKAPDGNQLDISLSGQLVLSAIILGDQAWLKDPSTNAWTSVDAAEAEADVQGLLPRDFWGVLPLDGLSRAGKDLGEEDVGGVGTHHFQITQAEQQLLADLATLFGGVQGEPPQAFSMDLWRADQGGWPAKATIDVTFAEGSPIPTAHIDWSTSDVNNSSISIQAPP